jgi:hypothetical protein
MDKKDIIDAVRYIQVIEQDIQNKVQIEFNDGLVYIRVDGVERMVMSQSQYENIMSSDWNEVLENE